MKRVVRAILLFGVLTSACATDSDQGAANSDPATASSSSVTTTAAKTVETTEVTTAPEPDIVVQHPFNEYVASEFGLEEMTVQDTSTGEWLGWVAPAEGVMAWYCSGRFPALNSMWSYGFGETTPDEFQSFDSWKTAFWDVADEMVCSDSAGDVSAPTTPTDAPTVVSDTLAADLVTFFYPGYELDWVAGDTPASLRLVGRSVANPGFQIGFDVLRSHVASEGCDFVDETTGETWCHSTAPSGLEMLAGRQPMVPTSHLAGIEADLSDLDVIVTDFQLNSNVAITLLGIAQASVEGWDGVSSEQAISMSLDLASGTWRRS